MVEKKTGIPALTIDTDGTGYSLDTDLYTAAGKTGTAENEGKYAHAWFVGYSNVEDPDLRCV